jgi:hypothetical protein
MTSKVVINIAAPISKDTPVEKNKKRNNKLKL